MVPEGNVGSVASDFRSKKNLVCRGRVVVTSVEITAAALPLRLHLRLPLGVAEAGHHER